jgi:hypothetical protein
MTNHITDTNTLTESCDNKFEFDIASVSFSPDISDSPLSNEIDYSEDSTDKEPTQLKIQTPGYSKSRPLSLSEFIDIFYKKNKIGYCSDICYSLIDITNSTKSLLIPALCDVDNLNDIVKKENGKVWCDITLKSFGRSPWWQTVELSTAMASAIAELNCVHGLFCKKISSIMRVKTTNGNELRNLLPDWDDVKPTSPGMTPENKIPNLNDLIMYLDAWCGVLSIARQLGYLPKPPKNKASLVSVCHNHNYIDRCCNRKDLFKEELWDLVPEFCENIKNIKMLEKDGINSCNYTFLHWNDDAENGDNTTEVDDGGFTTFINCEEGDLDTKVTKTEFSDMIANPTGYKQVSGLLKLIEMGLLDWNGCLSARDDENCNKEEEIKEDLNDWRKWFIDLQGGDEVSNCGYDYDSSQIIPPDNTKTNRKNTMAIAFLLKLSTLKLCSNEDFKNMMCINNFKNKDNTCYNYSQTLSQYFNPVSDDKNKLVNNCKYYNPCKRMNIKKNIIKSNNSLKHSLLRLCGCALTKEELLTTISEYIVRDMESPGGINNIINAKFNINYCKQGNGIENVVMYDSNVNIDLGVYVALASSCKDKDSVDKVLKYVFNNPSNDILGSVAESLLYELQTTYPACYPAGFNKTQITEYGAQVYENVLAGSGGSSYDATKGHNAPNLSKSLLTSNKFIHCFKPNKPCLNNNLTNKCNSC